GRGIGRGIAIVLASRGAAVALSDIDGEAAEAVAEEVRQAGGKAAAASVDVTSDESLQGWVSDAITEFGKVDICVPNAGVIGSAGFADRKDYNREDWLL